MRISAHIAFGLSALLTLAWPLAALALFISEPDYIRGESAARLELASRLFLILYPWGFAVALYRIVTTRKVTDWRNPANLALLLAPFGHVALWLILRAVHVI